MYLCKGVLIFKYSLLASTEFHDKFKKIHGAIDNGTIYFIDKMYADGLEDLHIFFEQFVKMTNNIGMGVRPNLVKKFNEEVVKANSLESRCVTLKMNASKDKFSPRRINDFNIELENSTVKVCCNSSSEGCIVF